MSKSPVSPFPLWNLFEPFNSVFSTSGPLIERVGVDRFSLNLRRSFGVTLITSDRTGGCNGTAPEGLVGEPSRGSGRRLLYVNHKGWCKDGSGQGRRGVRAGVCEPVRYGRRGSVRRHSTALCQTFIMKGLNSVNRTMAPFSTKTKMTPTRTPGSDTG